MTSLVVSEKFILFKINLNKINLIEEGTFVLNKTSLLQIIWQKYSESKSRSKIFLSKSIASKM